MSEPAECTASFWTVLLRPEVLPGTSIVVVGFHSFFCSPGAYETDLIAPSSSPEKKCGIARSGVVEGEPDANLEIARQLIGVLAVRRAGGALRGTRLGCVA